MPVRPETPQDHSAVREILTAAFSEPGEADLVDALRSEEGVISLVATSETTAVGHALFSPVEHLDPTGTRRRGIALGPIAVLPAVRRQGIGSALIHHGLAQCRDLGWTAAFVLGSPAYYGRFDWRPAEAWGLRCRWKVPAGVFQAMELAPGGLDGWQGLVRYHPAFDDLD